MTGSRKSGIMNRATPGHGNTCACALCEGEREHMVKEAAPALLEALIEVRDSMLENEDDMDRELFHSVTLALAKAGVQS